MRSTFRPTVRLASIAMSCAAVAILLAAVSTAWAGKDHCRTVKLDGSAGATSTDSVIIRVTNKDGSKVVDEACLVTVQPDEPAEDYAQRLPAAWFLNDPSAITLATPPCPTAAEIVSYYGTKGSGETKFPKKICSDRMSYDSAGTSSCKIKYTFKPDNNNPGTPKKGPQLDICCYEGPGCKGTKWGKGVEEAPINVQVFNTGVAPAFLPTAASPPMPAGPGEATELAVDPIGLKQEPTEEQQSCRADIAKGIRSLVRTTIQILQKCHLVADQNGLPDPSFCNSIGPSSDPNGAISSLVQQLRDIMTTDCRAAGSPSNLAYTSCPAPCSGLPFTTPKCVAGGSLGSPCSVNRDCDSRKVCIRGNTGPSCTQNADCDVSPGDGICMPSKVCAGATCTVDADCDSSPGDGLCAGTGDGVCASECTAPAGSAGNPCVNDAACDSAPGAGDGVCGSWLEVADCAACLAVTPSEQAVAAVMGATGSPGDSDPQVIKCKQAILTTLAIVADVNVKETFSCQKVLDKGKTSLPPNAPKCQDADRKGKRAAAAAKALDAITKGCTGVLNLSVGSAALDSCGTTEAEVTQCLVTAAQNINQEAAVAAVPESRCGDHRRVGEECDDGNTVDGDGCASDCTCEGTCGDGVTNPLKVCGELCDDGNTTNGDGCDNNCTPTKCGNGIVTAGEQCDGADDAACPGQCLGNCTCPGATACPTSMTLFAKARLGTSGSRIEEGYTGLGDYGNVPGGFALQTAIDCGSGATAPCGTCAITGIDPAPGNCRCDNDVTSICSQPLASDPACGGNNCTCYLSPPRPESTGGSPYCTVDRLTQELGGQVDVESGSTQMTVARNTRTYLGVSQGQPCPLCVGDPTPNDGIRSGTCSDGDNSFGACDTNGIDPTFGATSLDCPPASAGNITGAGLDTQLAMTTGTATMAADVFTCTGDQALSCPCGVCSGDSTVACQFNADCTVVGAGTCTAAQSLPNSCNGSTCTGSVCLAGPSDLYCDGLTRPDGSGVLPCVNNTDCAVLNSECPGGDCGACALTQQRRCFSSGNLPTPEVVNTTGVASPALPALVATSCQAATANFGINSPVGLPGPSRVRLEFDRAFNP